MRCLAERIPVATMPTLFCYRWQLRALQDRLEHLERYAASEDVDAVIGHLRKWLEEAAV